MSTHGLLVLRYSCQCVSTRRLLGTFGLITSHLFVVCLSHRSLPEIDGLSKETVLASWMAKFDCIFKGDEDTKRPRLQQNLHSELILSKEQLYDMFQQILGVKKFEHQLLFNALQVSFVVFAML